MHTNQKSILNAHIVKLNLPDMTIYLCTLGENIRSQGTRVNRVRALPPYLSLMLH